MNSQKKLFIRSLQPLIGSVIGVGIFGIPFVFAQAGFTVGLVHLAVLAMANGVLLLMYADIIRNTDGHPRLTGIVDRYLGKGWAWLATITMFGANWGAMVAYIIIGGEFLFALFSPIIGGSLTLYQLLFFTISALLVIGGIGLISRLEIVFVLTLLLMLGLITLGSVPHVDASNLTYVVADNWFLPFGVVLFAFGGLAAVPEMAHVLGRYKANLLRPAIITGMILVGIVYIAFAAVVTGVTGIETTEEGIVGLGSVVGEWALLLGSVIGLFSVFTSFLILALSNMDTIIYDFKRRHLTGWFISIIVPLMIFLLGARSFIAVVGLTGGILGSVIGLLVLYTYIKAKRDVCTPKRCLDIPHWILFLTGAVFVFGFVTTIVFI